MPKTDIWPFDFDTRDKGVTAFAPVTVMIKSVVKNKSGSFWGWKFNEDTTKDGNYTGVVWSAPREWNEAVNDWEPYTGPQFKQGQSVRVWLTATEKGTNLYRNVKKIETIDDQPTREAVADRHEPDGTPKPPSGAMTGESRVPPEYEMPLDYYRGRNRSIEKQVAAKIMADLAVAAITAKLETVTLDEVVKRARDMADELWEPKQSVDDLPWDATGEAAKDEARTTGGTGA